MQCCLQLCFSRKGTSCKEREARQRMSFICSQCPICSSYWFGRPARYVKIVPLSIKNLIKYFIELICMRHKAGEASKAAFLIDCTCVLNSPPLTGGGIKTEKALLARRMSLKAAAEHLMGFIYLQPPSDLGDTLPGDVLFFCETLIWHLER